MKFAFESIDLFYFITLSSFSNCKKNIFASKIEKKYSKFKTISVQDCALDNQ